MMRFTPSIPGERQGMRISSRLTVIATWRTYSNPLYGTSRSRDDRRRESQYIREMHRVHLQENEFSWGKLMKNKLKGPLGKSSDNTKNKIFFFFLKKFKKIYII
ncbi:hypothetical protein O3M35_002887 [Rhynocoris fuscipes]|uniref:Uncharacterized protein n=1 Tax=Rhynocoris fuscipes TaxID=488301 RepID=A0AAW1CN33_9HEMI